MRRSPALLVAPSVMGLVLACAFVACGFDKLATGPLDPVAPDAAMIEAATSADSSADADGGELQTTCSSERTVCRGVCTDTTSDPENCSGCDKACAPGSTCVDAGCELLCLTGTTLCSGACVDTKTDPRNCGMCGTTCPVMTPFCVDGACVPSCGTGETVCPAVGAAPAYCAKLDTDPKNCGLCGKACMANETCAAGAPTATCKPLCTAGSNPGDIFAPNMVGCTGKVTYANAGTLCPAGTSVCSPSQYVMRAAGKKPTYNYWTNTNLGYYGSDQDCAVDVPAAGYNACSNPMHVCTGYTDPLGNQCRWKNCGYQTLTNEYFGGCVGDSTAGALCCAP